MEWYRRYPDAALAGMAMLTLEECGAYNRLIDHAYGRNGVLPNDDFFLARLVGCLQERRWKRIKAALIRHGKIWVEDEQIKIKRVENEISSARLFSNVQSLRAKKRIKSMKDASHGGSSATMPLRAEPLKKESKKDLTSFLGTTSERASLATALPAGALARPLPDKQIHELTVVEVMALRRKKAAAEKSNGASPVVPQAVAG